MWGWPLGMQIGGPTDDARRVDRTPVNDDRDPVLGVSRRKPISGAGLAYGLTRPSILVFLCLGTLMHLGIDVAQITARTRRWDFSHYYVAALAMRDGLNSYAIDLRPLGQHLGLDGIARATDTPFFLLCFEPLTLLRPAAAYWSWFAINAASLVLAMFLILRAAPRFDRRQTISLCAIILLYPPLSNHIFFAQTQIVVLLLLVLAMRSFQSGRDRSAGVALAVAGLLKAFPLIIVGYFIVQRRWRAFAWTLAGVIAGTAATVIAFGVQRNVSFVAGTYLTRSAGFLARPANVALGSFVSRWFWYASGAVTMSPWLNWTRALTVIAVEVSVFGLTVFATLPLVSSTHDSSPEYSHEISPGKAVDTADRTSRQFALWVTAAIMLSPTAWIHYLVLLILPFMLIAAAGWNGTARPRVVWLMAASYTAISLSMAITGSAHGSLAARPYLKTALEEFATISLLLAYAAAWFFAYDNTVVSGDSDARLNAHKGNEVNLCHQP